MFTFRQLEIFITLARHERVIDASKTLKMSPSAISMSIRELEKVVEEQLFERIGKRLMLNERGKKFYHDILPHWQGLIQVYEHFKTQKLEGTIHIAASVTIMDYLMPKLIDSYLHNIKEVTLDLKSANSDDVIMWLKEGRCDIAFVEGDYADKNFITRKIQKDRLVVVTADKTLAQNGPYYIDTLASKKWILREKGSGTRSVFIDEIAPIDKELNIFIELDHTEAIKNLLLLDANYISCLSKVSVQSMLDKGRLFEVAIIGHRFERHFSYMIRKDKSSTLLFEHFLHFLDRVITL